jgi:hypothetical protein
VPSAAPLRRASRSAHAPSASTTGTIRVALSPSSHFYQMVEEARALPPVARAARRADLFAEIAALEAADAADTAEAAAAEEEEEEEENEDDEDGGDEV